MPIENHFIGFCPFQQCLRGAVLAIVQLHRFGPLSMQVRRIPIRYVARLVHTDHGSSVLALLGPRWRTVVADPGVQQLLDAGTGELGVQVGGFRNIIECSLTQMLLRA